MSPPRLLESAGDRHTDGRSIPMLIGGGAYQHLLPKQKHRKPQTSKPNCVISATTERHSTNPNATSAPQASRTIHKLSVA